MDNYQFCVEWAMAHADRQPVRVLDYGCGTGRVVQALRTRGVDARGCDVFFGGADYEAMLQSDLFRSCMKRIGDDGRIPYEDDSFDLIVNNQVMEHVVDIDRVLSEVRRVLKPGGKVLSIFPDKGVWREGHCGIPFLHWFPKGSRTCIYYAAALRAVGFGYNKGDKSALRWSDDSCDWLDRWTCYRKGSEIDRCISQYFAKECDLEAIWLERRLGRLNGSGRWIPERVRSLVARKPGGGSSQSANRAHRSNRPESHHSMESTCQTPRFS